MNQDASGLGTAAEYGIYARCGKRLLDIIIASSALIISSPAFALAAVAIRIDSPGPVLFAQEAVGIHGTRFRMLKFRSMYHGADNRQHRRFTQAYVRGDPSVAQTDFRTRERVYKILEDPRITRLGRWLRRTALDELPQLVNVLKGDMSLVGPRPPLSYEYELYDDDAKRRLDVPPGMTGLNQVGRRDSSSFKEMLDVDLSYISRLSFMLDLQILTQTIGAVVRGRGGH